MTRQAFAWRSARMSNTTDTPLKAEPKYKIASRVIAKCGGVRRCAELAGVSRSWVSRWNWPKEKGGYDGDIPRAAALSLWTAKRAGRVHLAAADFMPRPGDFDE